MKIQTLTTGNAIFCAPALSSRGMNRVCQATGALAFGGMGQVMSSQLWWLLHDMPRHHYKIQVASNW
jgi:hypothetical protein